MNGTLVIGLGNPLAGDDGIGWHLADRLAGSTALPPDTEVLLAPELLRLSDRLAGRTRVFLLDALLDEGRCGTLLMFDDPDRLDDRAGSVHHLPPTRALRLLRSVYPELRSVSVTFLCVTVDSVRMQPGLSPGLADCLDRLVGEVLAIVSLPSAS